MFDDPKKDLKRMERHLLEVEEEEQWLDEELADVRRLLGDEDYRQPSVDLDATQVYRRQEMPVRNYANGYGRGQAPYRQNDPFRDRDVYEDYYDEEEDVEYTPPRKSSSGLIILALLETLGIVAIVMYWLVKLL